VNLSWTPNADDETPSEKVEYVVERDGIEIARVLSQSLFFGFYTDKLVDGEAHRYTVRGVDEAGNRSEPATVDVAEWSLPAVTQTTSTATTTWWTEATPYTETGTITTVERDSKAPTLTLTPRPGRRAVKLRARRSLKIAARDDRPGVKLTVKVGGRVVKLRGGVLRLSAAQARRSTVTVVATDAAGNRTSLALRVRAGRVSAA
jgi:hypothetical protein